MTQQTLDPFDAPSKVPTVTFDKMPVGTTYELEVLAPADKAQGKDFETGEPAVWKNNDGSTSPKYSAVLRVKVLDAGGNPNMAVGQERAIWATIPSAMFAALQEAKAKAGASFDAGGKLTVRYSGDKPNEKNPRLNPAKQYQARYVPGAPAPKADPFASTSSQAPAAAPWDDTPPF